MRIASVLALLCLVLAACSGSLVEGEVDSVAPIEAENGPLVLEPTAAVAAELLASIAESKGLSCTEQELADDRRTRWFCTDPTMDRQLEVKTPTGDLTRVGWVLAVAIMPHGSDSATADEEAAAFFSHFVSPIGGAVALAWLTDNVRIDQARTTIGGASYLVSASDDDPDGLARVLMIDFAE